MTNEEFLSGIQQNIRRIRGYKLGMDGTGGESDCIGLIIGAIRLMGRKWTGTHGSNYAARHETKALLPLENAALLSAGDLVYKAKSPGQSGYALPDAYKQHKDQNDYYHVGVVTGVNPLEITHCTGVPGGIKRDQQIGNWRYFGKLACLQGEETSAFFVIGGRLKMRKGPGTQYGVLHYLPQGTQVTALSIPGDEEWVQVFQGEKSGYCMKKYLQAAEENGKSSRLEQLSQLLKEAQAVLQGLMEANEVKK